MFIFVKYNILNMADTKYPTIRYQTLNKCFRNKYKRYYIEDLIDACSEAIYDYCGKEIGCSRRTILNDIDFMESSAGWNIDLMRIRDGKRVYYRYRDMDYTINETLLSESETDKLNEVLIMLEKFKGMPCFEWIDELLLKLQSGLKKSSDVVMDFEQAPSLKGTQYIDQLFNSILYKQTLQIKYRTYNNKVHMWTIHPYLIKQYNNRWFLFGKNASRDGQISNLPLDRIESIAECGVSYEEDDGTLQQMLSSIIGVTVERDAVVEDVKLKFSERRFPYVLTKHIHKSQKMVDEQECIIKINVIPNKELEALILQYGNDVEVLSPESLRTRIKEKIQEMLSKY